MRHCWEAQRPMLCPGLRHPAVLTASPLRDLGAVIQAEGGPKCYPGPREHVCSILASLLRNLRGQQRTRLLNKFTENDSEKVDRLMELHFKYLDAMQVADKKIEGEKHDMVRRGEIIDNDSEDEFYLRRLDAGLFVLQHICYIMAEICNANVPQIRQRVHQILNMRGSSIKIVRHIIKEYAENIGDGRSPEFRESEQKRILGLLDNF
ncbi:Beta-catenin-like protein 1 [Myotis brandtii]|uniref:Beta-catenin-like protein 1 n=1 Tax=Myotis brandtii TaxID=109478 RepID=S7P567_MYOBR|nr:Beta-catenin-like protein 1 [Myotis brandtii]